MEQEGVLVIGSANMDLVLTTERFPNPGETVFGKKFEMFPGGKGANQAVSCSKLGAKTYFIGKMGSDDFQRRLSASMKDDGVNLDYLIIDEKGSTGTALITVDEKGENEIIVISGSNMKITPDEVKRNKDLFSKVKVVLTQLEIPIDTVLTTAKLAKENKVLFILNPAPAGELPEELLSMVDYLTPNKTELELLSGIKVKDDNSIEEAAEKLMKKGVKNVIVTLGDQGAYLINGRKKEIISSKKVNVVDSTGAGDAFNGAFAYSLSKGENIDDALQTAITVAAFSVTKMGAQSSMPALEELKVFVKSLEN